MTNQYDGENPKSEEIKRNILSSEAWVRILFMVFFAVVCWLLGIILSVLIIGQVLFSLVTGADNRNLQHLGASLTEYFYQILQFLIYRSEEKPFPFSTFPEAELEDTVEDDLYTDNGQGASVTTESTGNKSEGDLEPETEHAVETEAVDTSDIEPDSDNASRNESTSPKNLQVDPSILEDDVFADMSFTSEEEPRQEESPEDAQSEGSNEDDQEDDQEGKKENK